MAHDIAHLINLKKYPINAPDSAACKAVVKQVRNALLADGCAVVKDFLSPAGVTALTNEADSVARFGHKSFSHTNPYFTKDDDNLPKGHPARQFFERSNAFISADHFSDAGPLRGIYDFDGFDRFIQTCLQQQEFYRYGDPLADVIVNMAEAGNGFPWHFDTNNFTVTLAIQNADAGGAFEYAPHLRRDGENFDAVTSVLNGTSDRVRTLHLQPGDLQLFMGRNSLHRVTPLQGARPRYVAIFSYVDQPDMVATPERCLQLYGKVLPIHYARAGQRRDKYLD